MSGTPSPPTPPERSARVVVLTDANFESLVQPDNGNHGDWIIQFSAPWCGHCKSLAPTWEKLAGAVGSPRLHVGKLDATVEIATARRFDIRGFPSIRMLSKGRLYEYNGPRSLDALSAFARGGFKDGKGVAVPAPAGQAAVALEYVNAVAQDIHTMVVRKPVAALAFTILGSLMGILFAVLAFTLCLEKPPHEYVRYTDPATGEVRTVPYVRPAGMAPSPSPSPGSSPIAPSSAAASTDPAVKKAQ